ncbi:MAG: hypothetical protein ACFFD4_38520, partial [Candidatus Odinarchaeota archaeon]
MSTRKKPNKKYAQMDLDPDESAIAMGRNLPISPKHAREICKTLKGKGIEVIFGPGTNTKDIADFIR